MKYIIKLQANPSNPTYDTIFRHQPSPLFNTKRKAILPLRISMASSLSSLNPNNIPFVTIQFSPVPPWTIRSPTILFNLTTNIKANTTPEVYQVLYNELKQAYPNYQEIVTDGSKSSNKVSSASVFLNSKLTFSTNLPTMSSIFTAELAAIKIALSNIHKTNHKLHILFSDSKSALQSKISHKNLSNPITQDILLKYNV